jgi:hypothetical protein
MGDTSVIIKKKVKTIVPISLAEGTLKDLQIDTTAFLMASDTNTPI